MYENEESLMKMDYVELLVKWNLNETMKILIPNISFERPSPKCQPFYLL